MKYGRLIYNHIAQKLLRLDPQYLGAIRILGRKPRRMDRNGFYAVQTVAGSVYVRPDTSDLKVCYQVFYQAEYAYSISVYQRYFGNAAISMVDLGANIGLAAIYFIHHFESIRCLCVEPDLGSFSVLEENTKRYKKIDCVNCGVWPTEETLFLHTDFRDHSEWSRRFDATVNNSDRQSVRGRPLLSLLVEYKMDTIDILKIDIEGAEKKIIFDDKQFLLLINRIKFITIEIHPEVVDRIEATEFFRENGFKIFSWGETMNAVNTRFL